MPYQSRSQSPHYPQPEEWETLFLRSKSVSFDRIKTFVLNDKLYSNLQRVEITSEVKFIEMTPDRSTRNSFSEFALEN